MPNSFAFALALSMRCSVSGWLLRKASCSGMSMASRSNSSRLHHGHGVHAIRKQPFLSFAIRFALKPRP